mmetsp:Transcript_17713/g.33875  ORF Transcript_17713/g.33875 Transcript_17713/m.33875 type:complete len:318 (-) Transcript_17713:62-1015(-)
MSWAVLRSLCEFASSCSLDFLRNSTGGASPVSTWVSLSLFAASRRYSTIFNLLSSCALVFSRLWHSLCFAARATLCLRMSASNARRCTSSSASSSETRLCLCLPSCASCTASLASRLSKADRCACSLFSYCIRAHARRATRFASTLSTVATTSTWSSSRSSATRMMLSLRAPSCAFRPPISPVSCLISRSSQASVCVATVARMLLRRLGGASLGCSSMRCRTGRRGITVRRGPPFPKMHSWGGWGSRALPCKAKCWSPMPRPSGHRIVTLSFQAVPAPSTVGLVAGPPPETELPTHGLHGSRYFQADKKCTGTRGQE